MIVIFCWFVCMTNNVVVLNGTTFQCRQLLWLQRGDRKILSEVATNHIMNYANYDQRNK